MIKFDKQVTLVHDLSDDTYHVFPNELTAKKVVREWIDEQWVALRHITYTSHIQLVCNRKDNIRLGMFPVLL